MMAFKADWEKSETQHALPDGIIPKMVARVYPDKTLKNYHIIAGGCANINVKIEMVNDEKPFILRIYLRDINAASREQKIAELLSGVIPAPKIHKISELGGYHYSIAEFLQGQTLRDLLLSHDVFDLKSIMHDIGVTLSKITAYHFQESGFFDQNLKVVELIDRAGYIDFSKKCLANEMIVSVLSVQTLTRMSHVISRCSDFFPDSDEKNLVHADFDPANILVNKTNGVWEISGVLDWEFSFSGSVLCDVANMLRYAHHMPEEYETSFLAGLKSGGVSLPEGWQITVHLLNLAALLDCLARYEPRTRPKRLADIQELIEHILAELENL